ncbi:MAG: hypothetical protein M0C28_14535 [Candidatus Moduliflexus flocculans]|nr:hypothetical protein [Candidatus Moduliflexus flocculans]
MTSRAKAIPRRGSSRRPSGLINAIGLQGVGVEAFAAKVLPKLRRFDTAVIVNVCGADDDEYAAGCRVPGPAGRASPPTSSTSPAPTSRRKAPARPSSPRTTFDLVKRIKAASRRPLITKLSPNVTSIVEIAQAAEEAGTDAVALVNTFLAMAVDLETRRPKLGNVYGGLSGPAIKPIALRMVHQVASRLKVPGHRHGRHHDRDGRPGVPGRRRARRSRSGRPISSTPTPPSASSPGWSAGARPTASRPSATSSGTLETS